VDSGAGAAELFLMNNGAEALKILFLSNRDDSCNLSGSHQNKTQFLT